MSWVGYILIFFVSLSLSACASSQKKAPEIKEEFVTNIDKSGLKLFSYTLTLAVPKNRNGGMRGGAGGMRGGMGGTGMRGGGAKSHRETMMKRRKEVVYEKLKTKLDETGYCRESYIELDNYFVRGRAQIRGECKDSATAEDRMTFINDENT